jgi:hypothetical protein
VASFRRPGIRGTGVPHLPSFGVDLSRIDHSGLGRGYRCNFDCSAQTKDLRWGLNLRLCRGSADSCGGVNSIGSLHGCSKSVGAEAKNGDEDGFCEVHCGDEVDSIIIGTK